MLLNANQEENQVYIYGKIFFGIGRQFVQTNASTQLCSLSSLSSSGSSSLNNSNDSNNLNDLNACFSAAPLQPICYSTSTSTSTCFIYAVAQDAAGNTSPPSDLVQYILESATQPPLIDSTPPVITFFYPAPNALLNTQTPEFRIEITDDESGINTTQCGMWNTECGIYIEITNIATAATYSLTFHSEIRNLQSALLFASSPTPFPDGNYRLTISVKDNANNLQTSTLNFSIDATAPTISNLLPTSGSYINSGKPIILAKITDNFSGISSIKLCDNWTGTVSCPYNWTSGQVQDLPLQKDFSYLPLEPFSEGIHTLTLEAYDAASNSVIATTTFTIDTTPALITNISAVPNPFAPCQSFSLQPSAFSSCVSFATISFTITDANPEIWSVLIYQGSSVIRTISGLIMPETCTPTNGLNDLNDLNCSVSTIFDGRDDANTILPDGTYTYYIVTLDKADNYSEVGAIHELPLQITIDTTPPFVSFSQPLNNATLKGSSQEILIFSTDTFGVESVQFLANGTNYQFLATATYDVSRNLYTTIWDTSQLSAGDYTLTTISYDRASNYSTTSIAVKLAATVGPSVHIISPAPSAIIKGTAQSITVTFSQEEGNVNYLELYIDNATAPLQQLSIKPPSSAGTYTFYINTTLIPDGNHTLTARAYKAYPNAELVATSLPLNLKIDNTAPVISNLTPPNNGAVNTQPVTISAVITDTTSGINPASIQLVIDQQLATSPISFATDTGLLSSSMQLSESRHSIIIGVKDLAGNEKKSMWSFTVDRTLPQITNTSPASNTILFASPTQIIAWIKETGSGIDTTSQNTSKMFLNNNPVSISLTYDAVSSSYKISYTLTSQSGILIGTNTVTISVTDKASNTATYTWNFGLISDNTPPVISSLTPPPDTATSASPVTISAIIDDTTSGVNPTSIQLAIDWKLATQSYYFDSTTGLFTYTWQAQDQPLQSEGSHTALIVVRDYANNEARATWSFAVDRTPPEIIKIEPPPNVSANPNRIAVWFKEANIETSTTSSTIMSINSATVSTTLTYDPSLSALAIYHNITNPATELTEGTNMVVITIADKASNTTTYTWEFALSHDQTPPLITVLSPIHKSATSAQSITISALITDPTDTPESDVSGINPDSIQLGIDQQPVSQPVSYDTATGLLTYTGQVQDLPLQSEGQHLVLLSVKDFAWNESHATWAFIIDRTPPQIIKTEPTATATLTSFATGVIVWFKDTGTNLFSTPTIEMFINNATASTSLAYDDTLSVFVIYHAIDDPTTELAIGTNTVNLSITDSAGNTATYTWEFVVDTILITDLTPSPKTFINIKRPLISARIAEATSTLSLAAVEMRIQSVFIDTTVTPSFSSSTNIISYTPEFDLLDFPHQVTISITTTDGATASIQWKFFVDTATPTISDIISITETATDANTISTTTINFKIKEKHSLGVLGESPLFRDFCSGVNFDTLSITLDTMPISNYDIVETSTTSCSTYTVLFISPIVFATSEDHILVVEILDRAGNKGTIDWDLAATPATASVAPKLLSVCPVTAPIGTQITISGENFSSTTSENLVNFNYYNWATSGIPVLVKIPAQILESSETTLTATIPQGVPAFSGEFGITVPKPWISVSTRGVDTQNTLPYQVSAAPINPLQTTYIANNTFGSNILLLDTTTDIPISKLSNFLSPSTQIYQLQTHQQSQQQSENIFVMSALPYQPQRLTMLDGQCLNPKSQVILDTPSQKFTVSPDGKYTFALQPNFSSPGEGYITVIDNHLALSTPISAVISKIHTGANPTDLIFSPDGRYAYAAIAPDIPSTSHILVIDAALAVSDPINAIISSLVDTAVDTDAEPTALAITPDARYMFVAYRYENKLNVFDMRKNTLLRSFSLQEPRGFMKIAPSPEQWKYLYIAGYNKIYILDTATLPSTNDINNALKSTLEFPSLLGGITFSSAGTKAYITLPTSNDGINISTDPTSTKRTDSILALDTALALSAPDAAIRTAIKIANEPGAITSSALPAPAISSVIPLSAGPENIITIAGSNFSPVLSHNFVRFNNVVTQPFEASSTTLKVLVPAEASSGNLSVNAYWQTSNAVPFEILSPTISSITPASASFGRSVTINGSNFSLFSHKNSVRFNGVETPAIFSTWNTITTTVPYKTTSGNVTVTIGEKQSNSVSFTIPAPEIFITSPTDGTNFSQSDDTDGNSQNGVQIDVTLATTAEGTSTINLTVLNFISPPFSLSTFATGSSAFFKDVTIFPEENIIKVSLNDPYGNYAEDFATVTLSVPAPPPSQTPLPRSVSKAAYVCSSECGIGDASSTQALYVKDINTSAITQIMKDFNSQITSWSPNGRYLLSTENSLYYSLSNTSPPISVIDVSSAAQHFLCAQSQPTNCISGSLPTWSPNSSKIAYIFFSGSSYGALKVVPVDEDGYTTGEPIVVATAVQGLPIWSPDGNFLFYYRAITSGTQTTQLSQTKGYKIIRVKNTEPLSAVEFGSTYAIPTPPIVPLEWLQYTSTLIGSAFTSIGIVDVAPPKFTHLFELPPGMLAHKVTSNSDGNKFLYSFSAFLPIVGVSHQNIEMLDTESSLKSLFSAKSAYPLWYNPPIKIYNSIPPTISTLSPADSAYVNTTHPTISATIKDDMPFGNCTIENIKLVVNGIDVTSATSTIFNELTGVIEYIPPQDFIYRQTVIVTVDAEDCVGNKAQQARSTFFINPPPEISNLKPAPDSGINSFSVLVSATITDDNAVATESVKFIVNSSSGSDEYPGNYNSSTNLALISLDLLEDNYTVTLKASDIHNYEVAQNWSFTVDRHRPEVQQTNPPKDFIYANSQSQPTLFSATINDLSPSSGLNTATDSMFMRAKIRGFWTYLPVSYTPITSHSGSISTNITEPLPEGYNLVNMKMEDNAGNPVYNSWIVAVDNQPPAIAPQTPLPEASINKPYIKIGIDDNFSGIATNSITLKLKKISSTEFITCPVNFIPDQNNLIYCQLSLCTKNPCQPNSVKNGRYTLYISLKDNAGNLAESNWNFKLDTNLTDAQVSAPEIKNLRITPTAFNPTRNELVTVSFEITKPSAVTMEIKPIGAEGKISAAAINASTNTYQSTGAYSISWNGRDAQGRIITDSAYAIELTATDLAGFGGKFKLFTPPIKPPTIQILNPTASFDPSINKSLSIDYTIDVPSQLSLLIGTNEEFESVLLNNLISWEARNAGSHSEIWDGRDEAGILLPAGEYQHLLLLVTLPQNAVITTGNSPVISGLPSTEIIVNPLSSDQYTIPYTLSDDGCSDSCYASVKVFNDMNEQVNTILDNQFVSSGGTYNFNWNGKHRLPDGTEETMPYGVYSLELTAHDANSNSAHTRYLSSAVLSQQFRVSGDSLYIYPLPNDVISEAKQNGQTLDVQQSANDFLYVAPLADTSPGTHTFSVTFTNEAAARPPVTLTRDIPFLGPLNLSVATDTFNPTAGASLTYSFDLNIADSVNAAVYYKPAPDAQIVLDDDSQIAAILLNNQLHTAGHYEYTWDGKDKNNSLVPPGTYAIVIFAFSEGREYIKQYLETKTVYVVY